MGSMLGSIYMQVLCVSAAIQAEVSSCIGIQYNNGGLMSPETHAVRYATRPV